MIYRTFCYYLKEACVHHQLKCFGLIFIVDQTYSVLQSHLFVPNQSQYVNDNLDHNFFYKYLIVSLVFPTSAFGVEISF